MVNEQEAQAAATKATQLAQKYPNESVAVYVFMPLRSVALRGSCVPRTRKRLQWTRRRAASGITSS